VIRLYYAAAGAESAHKLTAIMRELGATVVEHRQKSAEFIKESGDLCVNWGGSQARHSGGTWLNHRITTNKLTMLKKFADAGVPTVKFLIGMPGAADWYARKIEHCDGDDLGAHLEYGDFYVQHIDTVKEFRVHVFQGAIIRASLKVPLDAQAKLPFRTGDHWGFSSADWKNDLGACKEAAISAVAALDYDFGGVDVATLPGGKPVVFEVNSAPWLGGDAARKYAKVILALA
jgi:hypothetical protein